MTEALLHDASDPRCEFHNAASQDGCPREVRECPCCHYYERGGYA